MPKKLVKLAIASSDELSRLESLQQLIEICIEQFNNPSESTSDRVDLLLSLYRFHAKVHLRELADRLQEICQELGSK